MNPILTAVIGSVAVLTASCTPSGDPGPDPVAPSLPSESYGGSPALQAKPSYARAQQLSDQVKVGMPQSTVEAMFGPPDKAGYQVYGRATGQPWRALVWEWTFQDVQPARALSIVFQESQGTWRVNHGDWPAGATQPGPPGSPPAP